MWDKMLLCQFVRGTRRWYSTNIPKTLSETREFNDEHDLKRLRSRLLYQSKKRGILENDLIIGGFATKHLNELSERELHEYDFLINGRYMEWDLYYYCSGRRKPPADLENNSVFKKIQKFAQSTKKLE